MTQIGERLYPIQMEEGSRVVFEVNIHDTLLRSAGMRRRKPKSCNKPVPIHAIAHDTVAVCTY